MRRNEPKDYKVATVKMVSFVSCVRNYGKKIRYSARLAMHGFMSSVHARCAMYGLVFSVLVILERSLFVIFPTVKL